MSPVDKAAGVTMIAGGLAITVVFGGGLIVFLVTDIGNLVRGTPDVGRLMTTLLMGPIVGGAPALLGLALARRGWRRAYGAPVIDSDSEDDE